MSTHMCRYTIKMYIILKGMEKRMIKFAWEERIGKEH